MIDLSEFPGGFCDRLRLVTWGIAVALLRGKTQLVLKDGEGHYCPYLFGSLCRVEGFTIVPWEESLGPCWPRVVGPRTFPGQTRDARRVCPPEFHLTGKAFQRLWMEAYTRLRPQSDIEAAVQHFDCARECVGLHLRYTDKIRKVARGWMEVERGQLPLLQATTLRLLKGYATRCVYLACDDALQKKHWTALLSQQGFVVVSHAAQFHEDQLRQTNGFDFGVDLFALAACPHVLGTTRSGVVHTANWIRGSGTARFAADHMLVSMLGRKIQQWLRLRR